MIRLLALAPLALVAAPAMAQSSTDVVVMRRVVSQPRVAEKPAEPASLIRNGGIESYPDHDGWQLAGGTQWEPDVNAARTGKVALRLNWRNSYAWQIFETVPGQTYVASAWFRGSGSGLVQLGNNLNELAGSFNHAPGGYPAWTQVSTTFKATQNVTYLKVEIINHVSSNDRLNVDDITVVKQ